MRNFDGSVTVTDTTGADGVDQLVSIEAVYFVNEGLWQSVEQLVGQYGTSGNDAWIAGTAHADNLYGLQGDDTFFGQVGNDTLVGGTGSDTAAFSGALGDYSFLRNEDGSVTVTDHANGEGTDVLVGIEGAYFIGTDAWRWIDQLAGQYGTYGDDTWIAGTTNADRLYGLTGDDTLFGDQGNDTLKGGDGYDTVVYSGDSTDFTFVLNGDGSVTATNVGGNEGVDKLVDIEAVYFDGDAVWSSLDALVA